MSLRAEIAGFVLLSCGLAWAVWAPLVWAGAVVARGVLPTHLPGLLAPALAAMGMAALAGPAARADLWQRVIRLPRGVRPWALALTPLPVIAVALGLGGDLAGLSVYSGLPEVHPALMLAVVLVVNGLGEELGWRGYLLPRAQALWGVRAGTLATGAIWAAWHLPMFAVLATYRDMGAVGILFGFGLGIMAGACVLAHLTALARGGVVLAVLWHTGFNLGTGTAVGGPAPIILSALTLFWALWLWRRAPQAMAVPPPRAAALMAGGGAG